MPKVVTYILVGAGGLVALVAGLLVLAVYLPESPDSIEHRGPFDIYWYHYPGLGEPGRSRTELWYHGRRLAEYPAYTSINPEMDRIIFVEVKNAPLDAPAPKGNGIYYFDARSGKQYLLAAGKSPAFYNGERSWPGSGARIDATPWSSDGSFAVVSYGDGTKLPELVFKQESVLLVDLATGEARNAAGLLGVSESEHIVFRRWSTDNSVMYFTVGDEERTLPVSVVGKKSRP